MYLTSISRVHNNKQVLKWHHYTMLHKAWYLPSSTILHHTIQRHTTPYNATLYHTTPHHTTPHHTAPHHTTPHPTAPHHTTPHHTTPNLLFAQLARVMRHYEKWPAGSELMWLDRLGRLGGGGWLRSRHGSSQRMVEVVEVRGWLRNGRSRKEQYVDGLMN